MKKAIKITLISLVALIVLVLAALKFAPGFIKDYVVAHSEEFIGRKMAIEDDIRKSREESRKSSC